MSVSLEDVLASLLLCSAQRTMTMISETKAPLNIKDFHPPAQQLPAVSLRRFDSGCVGAALIIEEKTFFMESDIQLWIKYDYYLLRWSCRVSFHWEDSELMVFQDVSKRFGKINWWIDRCWFLCLNNYSGKSTEILATKYKVKVLMMQNEMVSVNVGVPVWFSWFRELTD